MSDENVEIVRENYAAFIRGDLSAVLDQMSDDHVTFRPGIDASPFYGKEGFLKVTQDWTEDFAEWSLSPDEFIDARESVIVRLHQTARGQASGALVEADFWFVHTLVDGIQVRLDMCGTLEEALEAAGLAE
jgi:ketosteroid isomerase-like protein